MALTLGEEKEEEQKKKLLLYPTITYHLPKRARCLSFALVPSSSIKSSSSSSSLTDQHVIIVGDLSGDAIAFPIPPSQASISSSSSSTTNSCRLLLGHTASMLTGLNIVPAIARTTTTAAATATANDDDTKKQYILTADRDEKIRISSFQKNV